MDLNAMMHQVGGEKIILEHAVDEPEDDDHPQVLKSRESSHDQHDDSSDDRSDHRDKLQRGCLKRQQDAIGHPDDSKKDAVDNDADQGQCHKDTNIMP